MRSEDISQEVNKKWQIEIRVACCMHSNKDAMHIMLLYSSCTLRNIGNNMIGQKLWMGIDCTLAVGLLLSSRTSHKTVPCALMINNDLIDLISHAILEWF